MERLTNCRVAFQAQVLDHISMGFSRYIFILFLFTIIPAISRAAIVPNSTEIGGASGALRLNDNQWRVYGSFLGPDGPVSPENPTFDSCTVTPTSFFVGCNRRRVTADSILTISFSEDTQFTDLRLLIAYVANGEGFNNEPIDVLNTQPQPQSSQYQVQITWRELCQKAGGTIANYANATAELGGGITAEACMNGSEPFNDSFQIGVGVAAENSNNTVISEILVTVNFVTPLPTLGLFEPVTFGPPVVGSDDIQNIPLCNDFNGSPSGTLDINASGDEFSGFCDYKLIPGDEKIRIESDPTIVNNLGSYSDTQRIGDVSVPYVGFVLFLSNTDFNSTLPWNAQASVTNRLITPGNVSSGFESSSITSSIIQNEVPVFSRMASLDEAGNINHLFSDTSLNHDVGVCATIPAASDPDYFRFFAGSKLVGPAPIPPNGFTGRCPYATVPSLVTGLLTEDVNCFVATALKGSPYDYQVLALRKFRNHFLKSFSLGQKFISFYYKQGPKAAKWLNQNPEFKPVFRILLWPAYLVAYIFNTFGAFTGLVFLFCIPLLPLVILNLRRKTFIKI